jgi:hypothetical protein
MNIEHRTSNVQRRTKFGAFAFSVIAAGLIALGGGQPTFAAERWTLDVRCSMFDVQLLSALDSEEAVETGREILSRGWVSRTHPWYDSRTDEVDLVPLPKPKANWDFSWLRNFWNWLTSGWQFSFFGWNFSINLAQILLGLLLIVVLYFTIRYLRRLYREKSRHQTAADGEGDDDWSLVDRVEALPVPIDARKDDLLAAAREAFQRGDYREAMVLLYSYLLLELDKRQVIRLAKGKTNRQYLREVGPRQPLRSLFERTMEVFEAVFFGDHKPRPEAFEACWSSVEQVPRLLAKEEE